jgi:hypothetical protein
LGIAFHPHVELIFDLLFLTAIGKAFAAVGAAFTSFFADEAAAKSGKTIVFGGCLLVDVRLPFDFGVGGRRVSKSSVLTMRLDILDPSSHGQ